MEDCRRESLDQRHDGIVAGWADGKLCENVCPKNVKFGAEKTLILRAFMNKIKILCTYNLHCQKLEILYQNSVTARLLL